ncbi:MAG: LysR family transcriptional regulator [Dorea sp.]
MNWNQLQYVITITEEKSITKAAKRLFISQPSLSLSIQSLEKETGVTLFQRTHGEMTLTYAGTLFYEWAVATLHSQEQLNLKLNDISQEKRNLIRIGLSPHRSLILLPKILDRFYTDFPYCEVHITEKPTWILKQLLEQNEIDFMIDIPHPDTINYQSDILTEEKILLAVPASYTDQSPFSRTEKEAISLQETASYPYILLSSDQILGNMSRKMCESAAFYPNVRMTCEGIETALSLVNRQLGITFAPEIMAKQGKFCPNICYYPIRQFYDTRQLCLIYPKNRYQHIQLTHLLSLFRETVPQLYQM